MHIFLMLYLWFMFLLNAGGMVLELRTNDALGVLCSGVLTLIPGLLIFLG